MQQNDPNSEVASAFEKFRPHLGEGLTGRATRLESTVGAEAFQMGMDDVLEVSERLSRAITLVAAPGRNARWLEGVVAEDELRKSSEPRSRTAEKR